MIETPHITESAAQRVAVVHLTIPRAEIRNVMRAAIADVMGALAAQKIAATGPAFSHHLRFDPETFDFEVGLPIAASFTPAGRVVASELPAATVARAVYRGGYEGLAAAWGELDAWMAAAGHRGAPNRWERYVRGPESGPNPQTYLTELNRPLLR